MARKSGDSRGLSVPPPRSPVVRDLTPSELESMQREFARSMAWAREQLRIDPELKHLGPAGGSQGEPGSKPKR